MNIKGKHDKDKRYLFKQLTATLAMLFIFTADQAFSQTNDMLEMRVGKLEDYVSTIQPTMLEISNNLNDSIQEYTQGLESSLENYSVNLQSSLDDRLARLNRKAVVLNQFSKAYQSIETNTGTFLISVDRSEPLEDGLRLHLNIGNPNFADYQNFQLRLVWGTQWAGKTVIPYEKWRQSLQGVDFTFQGKIEKGKWNAVTVDLTPSNGGSFSHIECEMTVSSVELGYD